MADPIKILPDEEEEAVKERVRTEVETPEKEDERRSGKERRPITDTRAVGFFRTHPRAKWIIAALAVLILIGGFFVWRYYSARESTDDAQIDGHIDPISARVTGTVIKVLHDDNEVVQAGTLLVELDPKDYQVAVDRARADLANAQANAIAANVGVPLTQATSSSQLLAADAGVKGAQRDIELAGAKLNDAQAMYAKTSADLKRMEMLIAKDEISHQQYDAAVAANNSAKANVDAATSAIAAAESRAAQSQAQAEAARTVPEQLKVTRARARAASAEVQRAISALAQAELNLQYTKIFAPVTGVLSKRSVEPGQTVQAGQPLFSIVDLDDIWVTANFKETQLRDMKVGQRAKIKVDAYGKEFSGTVESIGGATGARFSLLPPENATGNYVKVVQRIPVRIRLDKGQDPNHQLRPGMSVEPVVFTK
ncbi:MAG TPA: HlyD family secretion protein [Candidatus Acidoferrales bacterium]|nr:HlyD family secretion protein [Candidatus Acidoferrales bacterium]